MNIFFIEMPEGYLNTEFELIYQIRNTYKCGDILYYIFRDDDYFANVANFIRIKKEQPEATILTNDDRLLAQFRIDEVSKLCFWNYKLEKFIDYRKFYPNIRKANNIENMWRRRIFPNAYYIISKEEEDE